MSVYTKTMTLEEREAKSVIMYELAKKGYSPYKDLLRKFIFHLTSDPEVVGYIIPNEGVITLNRYLDLDAACVVVMHEILHQVLKHSKLELEKLAEMGFASDEVSAEDILSCNSPQELLDKLSPENKAKFSSYHQVSNIAADYDLGNRAYTSEMRAIAKSIILNGEVIEGLVARYDHPEWEKLTFFELFDKVLEEQEKNNDKAQKDIKNNAQIGKKGDKKIEEAEDVARKAEILIDIIDKLLENNKSDDSSGQDGKSDNKENGQEIPGEGGADNSGSKGFSGDGGNKPSNKGSSGNSNASGERSDNSEPGSEGERPSGGNSPGDSGEGSSSSSSSNKNSPDKKDKNISGNALGNSDVSGIDISDIDVSDIDISDININNSDIKDNNAAIDKLSKLKSELEEKLSELKSILSDLSGFNDEVDKKKKLDKASSELKELINKNKITDAELTEDEIEVLDAAIVDIEKVLNSDTLLDSILLPKAIEDIKAERSNLDKVNYNAKDIKASDLSQFKASLLRFIKNQVDDVSKLDQTYRVPNTSYARSGIIMPKTVLNRNEKIPKVNFYYDRSPSCDNPTAKQAEAAGIAILSELIRQKKIVVKQYKFAASVEDLATNKFDHLGTRGQPILDHIKETKPDNVVIITDSDISDCVTPLTLPGGVWLLFIDGYQSENLIKHIKGKKITAIYNIMT